MAREKEGESERGEGREREKRQGENSGEGLQKGKVVFTQISVNMSRESTGM